MIVAASRLMADRQVCFVGVGLPSAAALLALRTHAPGLVLMYESGTVGSRPDHLPLSVADPGLSSTAQTIVGVPEIFNYWVQPGRVDVAILGTGQIDRFANLNSTVIGPDYDRPKIRLPGAGGAPEIAAGCRELIVIVGQSRRTFVETVDFVTSLGHGAGRGEREALGFPGHGPKAVVTDIGIYEPDPKTRELVLTRLQPDATIEQARSATGWDLAISAAVEEIKPPSDDELQILRGLRRRNQSRS